jgi:hypothetical protein
LLAGHPIPKLEDRELHLFCLLPLDMFSIGYHTRSLSSHQHRSPGHWGAQTYSPRQGGSPLEGVGNNTYNSNFHRFCNQVKSSACCLLPAGSFLVLLFGLEVGVVMFLLMSSDSRRITRRYIPEDSTLPSNDCENYKSKTQYYVPEIFSLNPDHSR